MVETTPYLGKDLQLEIYFGKERRIGVDHELVKESFKLKLADIIRKISQIGTCNEDDVTFFPKVNKVCIISKQTMV